MGDDISRLDRVEEMLAHQESQLQDLSAVMIAQGHEIDGLKQQIAALKRKLASFEEGADDGSGFGSVVLADQKPPHY